MDCTQGEEQERAPRESHGFAGPVDRPGCGCRSPAYLLGEKWLRVPLQEEELICGAKSDRSGSLVSPALSEDPVQSRVGLVCRSPLVATRLALDR